MKVQDAIQASNYASAQLVIGDILTVIDGSSGPFILTRGEEDMPPRESIQKDEASEILPLLDEEERSSDRWLPIQEAEA